jgi:nucleoside-diphosphate-sugar epimerase
VGFIGSHLVDRLVGLGAAVRVADNLERGSLANLRGGNGQVEFLNEDLREAASCRRVCSDIDVVFHLASRVGGIGFYLSKPGEVLLDNTLIDAHMLQAALDAGVRKYVYASSAHVYPIELQASPDAAAIREDQAVPAHPELSYGWAKLLGERQIEYCVAEGREIRASIARIIGAYGPRQDIELGTGSAIPVFIRRAIEYPKRSPYVVLGTGAETRSYCYVSDIVDGLLVSAELLEEQKLLGPFNLGAEGRLRIGDLAREVVAVSQKDIEIVFDSSHPTVIWGQSLDCSRAHDLLRGWQPRVSLRRGLELTYADVEGRIRQA